MSSVPGDDVPGPAWLSYVGHLTEYTVLGVVLMWARRPATWAPDGEWHKAIGEGLVLAGLDEYYQETWIAGRGFEPVDVVLDAVGLVIGIGAIVWYRRRRRGAGRTTGDGTVFPGHDVGREDW